MPRLIDGREVASDSPEWRAESLARYVLDLPNRNEWLIDYAKRRGEDAAKALADRMRLVRDARAENARAVRDELRARTAA
jgi:hypothetical protein